MKEAGRVVREAGGKPDCRISQKPQKSVGGGHPSRCSEIDWLMLFVPLISHSGLPVFLE